ncbi:MAG: hypothetical protein ACPHJ1_08140, partial [Ilumatobacteraceae bacterium]
MRPVYSAHWIRGQHATAAHTGVSGVPSTHAAQASTASTLQTGARAHVHMMQATSQKLSLSEDLCKMTINEKGKKVFICQVCEKSF